MTAPTTSLTAPSTTTTTSTTKTAFISGPIDTGPDNTYFRTYYIPRINTAIEQGHDFIIGPVPSGVDHDALYYLLAYPIHPTRITIFVTPAENSAFGDGFRKLHVNVRVVGDLSATSRDRDAAMTGASSYDILRWRTSGEAREFYGDIWREGYVTNTERNWRRRRGISEMTLVREEDVDIVCGDEKPSYGRRAVDMLYGSWSGNS
ncbi:hypothetical protein BDV29DRAFT_197669 [Aspergillus leporis]|jgi:hypothetical protein|uniref:Uncharacterized protein n=1 Tax=Aspergillus leporis TaxID=41062 RepID=A0A5N5WTD3_9EURO|nr:hypothetical protein BDV29DRAFT_197669 [Aspergillus leporis]